ncbi:Sec-independent protein translocase protein TatB [Reinekea blandensis]|uniref:Sec-independent protein translocase protein TatB n=1 Tax=Reinekea blandensis MED297 TaxID=314283 RepID=A4B9U8_9GAMM|nr:Sec-independent protein translocase protein TatB [Reinekea blandensis]EAR11399.1 Twin-arginine translocation protein TatB [Reinekea sp. MED297] [Reinekea blandensis MED297]
MFDVGFAELLVLAVIAMVVVGPERLPGVLRTVGKTVGQARRFMTGLQNQIEQEVKLDELNKKIMAETKDLDFTKPSAPTHQSEDAEVPSIAPEVKTDDAEVNPSAEPAPQDHAHSDEDAHDAKRS